MNKWQLYINMNLQIVKIEKIQFQNFFCSLKNLLKIKKYNKNIMI